MKAEGSPKALGASGPQESHKVVARFRQGCEAPLQRKPAPLLACTPVTPVTSQSGDAEAQHVQAPQTCAACLAAEYLKDFNATQAAIRAGYAEKSAGVEGHRLLKHPEIAALIAPKREAGDVARWWAQAVTHAGAPLPVLLYRADRAEWRAVWPLATLLAHQTADYWRGMTWTANTTVEAWAAVARELPTATAGRIESQPPAAARTP